VAFVRRFRERVKRDFGADLGAAQKKNVFGSRSSRLAERDSISTRPRRSWRERARGGAPGEWSPRCCRPRFRRSRPGNCCAGGGGGSAGGVSSGRRGGRRREEEGGPGRPGFEGRNLSGVPRRVVPRCAPPGPRASSRARARRRGWCGPPPGQPRGPSCAGPRGARSYSGFAKATTAPTLLATRALECDRALVFQRSHDEDVATTTGRDDENGYARAREREPDTWSQSLTRFTLETTTHPNTVFFRDCLAAREFFARPPRHSPPPRARRLASLTTPHGGRARSRRITRWLPLSPTLPRPPRFVTSRFCSAAACSASSPSSSRTRP
jgi:hypothetical protein